MRWRPVGPIYSAMLLRFLIAFVLLAGPAHAQVGSPVSTERASSRLVAEVNAAVPGETVTLALLQDLQPGWHTYWKNPGDSGLPLELDWTLPQGVTVSEPIFPLPHRLPFGPLVNFGFEDQADFLFELSIPEDLAPGRALPIAVEARWLICSDICVPEEASLRLLLPVAAAAGAPTAFASRIETARAAQPGPATFAVDQHEGAGGPVLVLGTDTGSNIELYPETPGLVEPSSPPVVTRSAGRTQIALTAGYEPDPSAPLAGILRLGAESYAIDPVLASGPPPLGEGTVQRTPAGDPLFLPLLGLAVLGGALLNLMPCVFPIVFLKAANLSAIAPGDRGAVRAHGLLYTAGVLTAFAALALLLFALRAGGEALGWGFHLQSPVTVGIFAVILFLVGLNLAGVFEVGASLQRLGGGVGGKGGEVSAFLLGLLAVAVAAPCIGPFLGGAVGAAILSPNLLSSLVIFFAIGVGLALPYLVLSLVPGLAARLPRPGPWMVAVRQVFAFGVFGTVVWLVWLISAQAGSGGVLTVGLALLFAAAAGMLVGAAQRGPSRWTSRLGGVAGVIALGLTTTLQPQAQLSPRNGSVPYGEAALASLRAAETPVFVVFTAAWCVTCKVNEAVVIDSAKVQAALAETGTTLMVADWTLRDPEITRALERFGRAGVPLYLYYPPSGAPDVLPQLLTVDGVLHRLRREETA